MAVCGHPPLFCWLQLGFYASKQAVAATASSPGAKDDSFTFFGKGKATEVNQGGLCSIKILHSSYKIQVYFDSCAPVGPIAGNNHGLAPKGEHR